MKRVASLSPEELTSPTRRTMTSLDLERDPYVRSNLTTTPNNWFRTDDSKLVYTPDRVSCYEVRHTGDGDDTVKVEKGLLWPEEVEGWLEASKTRASDSHFSLRILFGECDQLTRINNTSSQFMQIPFGKQKFEHVLRSMRVPPQFVWALEDSGAQVSRFRIQGSSDWSYLFKIGIHATGFYTMSVHYDQAARLTSVFLLAQSYFHDIGMIVAMLYWKNYKALISRPMLVPFMVCTCVSAIHASKVQLSIATLNAIEEDLGQHTYQNRYKGDPLEVDFVAATTALNSNSTRLAINEARLKSLISALSRIHDYVEVDSRGSLIAKDEKEQLADHVNHLRDYCENLLLRNEAEQKRTSTQLSVVYNFMAQKDNLLNIALAQDSKAIAASSKRDSSAMKTIAAVTMVFLPGTYVAALFAMPLFIWDAAPGSSVLNDRFWYYWVVTIPLTTMVLSIWFLFVPLYKLAKRIQARINKPNSHATVMETTTNSTRPWENAGATHRNRRQPPVMHTRPSGLSSIIQT